MWFIWKNEDSRNNGLWVAKLPPITTPEERVTQVEIPGKPGVLTLSDGVHKCYTKNCIVTARRSYDPQYLCSWLSGESEVIFYNEPTKRYFARILGSVSFNRISNDLMQATIPFFCEPYKGAYPSESVVDFTGTSGSIFNPGDVDSRPAVTVNTTGTVTLTINGIQMILTDVPTKLIVDCDAGIITKQDGTLWTGTMYGDFFKLTPGSNSIVASKSVTLNIEPRWRWL